MKLGEVVGCGSGVLRSSGNLCGGRVGGKIPEIGWDRGGRGEVGRSPKLVVAGIFGGGEEGSCLTPATSGVLRCGLRWKSWYNEEGEAVAVDVGRLRRMSRLGRMQDVDKW